MFLDPTARLQPQASHVLDLQFVFDPGPVGIDRRHSQPEFFSDFAGCQAPPNEAKNFQLAIGEPITSWKFFASLGEIGRAHV